MTNNVFGGTLNLALSIQSTGYISGKIFLKIPSAVLSEVVNRQTDRQTSLIT